MTPPIIVRRRMKPGVSRRPRAALANRAANRSAMAGPDQSARSLTWRAVIRSTSMFPLTVAARCWRLPSRIEAAISTMPSMWAAIWRTSQSGQAVGIDQSGGSRDWSSSAQRPYSVAARRIAVRRSRAGVLGFISPPGVRSGRAGRQAQVVGEQGDRPGQQGSPEVAVGIVGQLLVDQAADQAGVQVEVGLAANANLVHERPHEAVALERGLEGLLAGGEVRQHRHVHQLVPGQVTDREVEGGAGSGLQPAPWISRNGP